MGSFIIALTEYQSGGEIKKDGMDGNVACIMQGFGSKLGGMLTLGRLRHRWENTFQCIIKEIRWQGMDWIHLAQPRDGWQAVVNAIMNLGVS
jgi:hypothetical protein